MPNVPDSRLLREQLHELREKFHALGIPKTGSIGYPAWEALLMEIRQLQRRLAVLEESNLSPADGCEPMAG